MRALVQRVKQASVTVDGATIGAIDAGLLILLGVRTTDTPSEAAWIVDKCLNLRIFTDADGKFNLSALDVSAGILVVSQFTLYGDSRKGRRPSFTDAARPELAVPLYEHVVELFARSGLPVATGQFAADMQVALVNDGPVTLLVEREAPGATAAAESRDLS